MTAALSDENNNSEMKVDDKICAKNNRAVSVYNSFFLAQLLYIAGKDLLNLTRFLKLLICYVFYSLYSSKLEP